MKLLRLILAAAVCSLSTACLCTVSSPPASAAEKHIIRLAGPEENWVNFAGAVARDRADVVADMISQGISPNTIVEDGDPALVRAIRLDNDDVIKVLLESSGIDLNLASDLGETALMLASFKGRADLVNLLINRGAEVNRPGGWTPLHYAATNGHDEIVKTLIEKGAKVNAQTSAGVTPLYMAARLPSRRVVQTLLRAGAYRDLCTDRGLSPADAAKEHDRELAEYLAIEKCARPRDNLPAVPRSNP